MFHQPISKIRIIRQVCSIKNKNSRNLNNISARFLIISKYVLAIPLKILYNYVFKFGIFPQCLKSAKIFPIYKQGDKTEVRNYRPLSILSNFSKVLKKLVYKRHDPEWHNPEWAQSRVGT